jgi:carbamoyl-phosphate synthase large subunit
VLVLGAGSAGAENLSTALRAGKSRLVLLGSNHDRFVLRNSTAKARLVVPEAEARGFAAALAKLIDERGIDLVIPTTDAHVLALSRARRGLRGKVFLPAARLIELCQDKFRLARALRAQGLPAPRTLPIGNLGAVPGVFRELGGGPLWCRPRSGSCARGGGKVASAAEARRWIEIWQSMQGLSPRSFTLSEYLPGRELLCQSVWKDGRMIVADTYERLAYFGTDNIPSGVTSLSSLAKTVREPAVVELCRKAIRGLAPRASGVFSIDTKEDARNRPHITEINAGRLFLSMTAFDPVLRQNISLAYVRTALGEPLRLEGDYLPSEDYYMVRDMDLRPGVFHADDLFKGERWDTAAAGPDKVKRTKSRSSSRAR